MEQNQLDGILYSKYSNTPQYATMRVSDLNIPGGMSERIAFDVIISQIFTFSNSSNHLRQYLLIAASMQRRLPTEALNLLIKMMPRMDPEIRDRFYSFFAFITVHSNFNLNCHVLKKITEKEGLHFKYAQELFKKMMLLSNHQTIQNIVIKNNLNKEFVPKNINPSLFKHDKDEDENYIKIFLEKLTFEDEEREELENFYKNGKFKATGDSIQKILLVVL